MTAPSAIIDLKEQTAIIADDDQITRGLLRAVLSVAGLNVLAEVGNAERALALYKRERPNIVCLDIEMPGMGGLEAIKQLRVLSSDVVLLVISGNTTPDNIQHAMKAGADGIVAKPFNTARVTAEIERALRKRLPNGPAPSP